MDIGREDVKLDEFEDEKAEPFVPAKFPTGHLPGTAGKMEVMAARFERGECLFHRDDGIWADGDAGTLKMLSINELETEEDL